MSTSKNLKEIYERYKEISKKLEDPSFVGDPQYPKIIKEYGSIKNIAAKYEEYLDTLNKKKEAEALLKETSDQELKELAEIEIEELKEKSKKILEELKELLVSEDENSVKNVIMEIRAGTGGEEASLFAADLFRAYSKYAEKKGWKVEIIDSTPSSQGGFKEIIFLISGNNVYGQLRYESGTHRVQRVPITEASGRIHTSAATVAVLPEIEEVELEIDPKDLKIEVCRSSGPGGQHVNTTDSAVRITHLPTGITVSCQDEKSQLRNKQKAMKVLRSRVYEYYKKQQEEKIARERKNQIGSGDRSEKIRTYNFPQNRVTDHRANLTLYTLPQIMDGEMEELIHKVIDYHKKKKIQELGLDISSLVE